MKFNIRGSKMEVTDAIKTYIQEKIGRLDKYFENSDEFTANVLVKATNKNQIVEVTIPISKVILRAEESHNDLYAAIDLVVEKLERQIRKNKTRMKQKNNRETMNMFIDFEIEESEIDDHKIIKRKRIENKPMDEEEAILQMNLLGHEFFIFDNIKTHTTSVLYKRKDGNYGIIDVE